MEGGADEFSVCGVADADSWAGGGGFGVEEEDASADGAVGSIAGTRFGVGGEAASVGGTVDLTEGTVGLAGGAEVLDFLFLFRFL